MIALLRLCFAARLRPAWWVCAWLLLWCGSAQAVVDVNKAFTPVTRQLGQTSTLIITLFNSNTIAATGTGLTDTMPAGLGVTNVLANTCGGTASNSTNTLVLTGGTIPAGISTTPGSCSISAVVTAQAAGTFVNTLPRTDVVSSEGNAAQDAQATITVNPAVPLTGSKTVPVSAELHGDGTRSFTITLNNSNALAVTGLGFTDTLPTQLVIDTAAVLANSCGGTLTDLGGGALGSGDTGLRLTGGTIAAASSCSISFVVRPSNSGLPASGGVTNSIAANAVTTTQGISNSAALNANINLRTGALIGKAFAPATIVNGGSSTLSLTLSNRNLTTITNVDLTDIMPAGVTVVGLGNNTCGGATSFTTSSASVVGATLGPAPSPTANTVFSCVIQFFVTSATTGVYLNNVTAGSFGTPSVSYALASGTLNVIDPSPVSLTKAFNPTTIVSSGTSLLTLSLFNSGAIPASITSFSDNLLTMGTTAVRVAASPPPSSNCGGTLSAVPGSTTISLTGGTIAANGNCQITVAVQAEPNGVTGNRVNTVARDSLVTSVGNNENTVTNNITINAALTAAKAFFPATIAPSGTSRLTVTLTHAAGAVPFTNLSFTDPLPAGHTVASPPNVFNSCGGTVTATAGAGSFSLGGGSLPLGASSCIVGVTIQAPAGAGSSTNSIPAGSVTTAEGIPSRAVASAVLTRSSGVAVSVNKSFNPTSINGGGLSMLTVSISNNDVGAINLTSAGITDTFPAGMQIASPPNASFSGAGCSGGSIDAAPNNNYVSISGASINANAVCQLTVQVTGLLDGNLINTVPANSVVSAQSVTNVNTPAATLTVLRNVNIGKAFIPSTIAGGGTSTLLITIYNSNNVVRNGTTTNTFTDNLPAGMTLASASSTNSCGGSITNAAGGPLAVGGTAVRLNGGVFNIASFCTISVVVTVPAGSYTNTIAAGSVVTAEGSSNADPSSAVLIAVLAPTVSKSFAPTSLGLGQTSVVTLSLSNPNNTASLPAGLTGVSISDALPSGLSVAVSGPAGGTCVGAGSNALSAGATTVTLSGLTLAPASTCTVSFGVVAAANGVYLNRSSGISSDLVPTPSAPSGTATLTVLAAPTISKSFSPSSINSGGTGTAVLTITLGNPNASATLTLANPALTDIFPTSPGAMVAATPANATHTCGGALNDSGNGTLAAGDTGLRYNNGSIPPGGSCSISLTVFVPVPGSYLNNSSAVNTTNGGSSAAGATAQFTVIPSIALQISKTNGVTTLEAGQTTAYTITVTNLGPSLGNGATLTDPAAPGLDCTELACTATGGAVCPGGLLDVAVLQSTGYVIPVLPVGGAVDFVLGCGVTATGQ
jgi:uncharacterized repeat protein (TIGR01451 family)